MRSHHVLAALAPAFNAGPCAAAADPVADFWIPQEYGAFIPSEIVKWEKVIRNVGVEVE